MPFPVTRAIGRLKALDLTFWLQVAAMSVAARSVEEAGWVETPSLTLVVLLATLVAVFLVRQKPRRWTHHLEAVLMGAFLTYLGGVYMAQGNPWYHQFGDLHSRVVLWWRAVTGEDVTTDILPLSMVLIAITWLVSYLTAWALFRYRSAWTTLLPVGAGITINLSYLPERFSLYFFLFLFIGLLMTVHITSLRRRSQLQERGIPYPAPIHQLSLAHGLWLSAVTLGVALAFPLADSPFTPLKGAFRPMNRSVDGIRAELHRIFAAVPGHNVSSPRFFGSPLPLVRPVPTGEETVFFADPPFPLYWSAIAYDQYTSKAWKVENTSTMPMWSANSADPDLAEEELGASPTSVAYNVWLHVSSPYLMIAGDPVLVEPDAQQELPDSLVFQVDLVNPQQNGDLPSDLQGLASTLASISGEGQRLEPRLIPYDLLVHQVTLELPASGRRSTVSIDPTSYSYYTDLHQALQGEGRVISMEIGRARVGMSAVSRKPVKSLGPKGWYSVIAEVSLASEDALRRAGQSYPRGILDRYVQLPDTLPSRVVALALALSSEATNHYDKAVAIETYLREMQYSTASQSIPYDADVVDHFLFESQEGYSDYFASAMTIMLRGIGVPTRFVLGFGPGVEEEEKRGYTVRDKDSHSWPEVYFPNVGWVAFEPTPIYEPRPRGLQENPFGSTGYIDKLLEEEPGPEPGLLEPEEEQKKRTDVGGPLPGGSGPRSLVPVHTGSPLGSGGVLFALFLLTGMLLLRALWLRQYGGLRYPGAAYERLHRLASFLGIPSPPSQTPYEFARSLSRVVPGARDEIELVCASFVRQRYGGKEISAVEGIQVAGAFNRAKRELLAQLMGGRETPPAPVQEATP